MVATAGAGGTAGGGAGAKPAPRKRTSASSPKWQGTINVLLILGVVLSLAGCWLLLLRQNLLVLETNGDLYFRLGAQQNPVVVISQPPRMEPVLPLYVEEAPPLPPAMTPKSCHPYEWRPAPLSRPWQRSPSSCHGAYAPRRSAVTHWIGYEQQP